MTPEGWWKRSFGEFCRQVVRRAESEELPILSVSKGHGLLLQSEKFKKRIASKETGRYKRIRYGEFAYDPMLLWSGSIGRQKRVEEGIVSPAYYVFQTDSTVEPEFFEALLRWAGMLSKYADISQGTNVRRRKAGFEDFCRLAWDIPPLQEQRKITTILSSVDAAIEKAQAVIEQLGVVKKSLLGELLTKGTPGRHKQFKETELGWLPSSWRIARVGDCCNIENQLRKPLNEAARAAIPGPYPYYGPTRVLDYISEYRVDGTYALIGEDGDHFLKFAKWPMTQLVSGRFNVNNHAHLVRGTAPCQVEWFFYFFLHRDIGDRLTRQGANRYKLKKETLLSLPIALPPPDEQREIIDILDPFEPSISANVQMLGQMRRIKAALSDALLSGTVRVSVSSQGAV
jgi:hypothetical protein